ncbi:hypothetical protein BKA63DRAFT_563300 [Paraphoma chrysanthemicola]|nr:hypothetical protein BKA63DRAFT_563300 [Paraphoma chrysanthemicola]
MSSVSAATASASPPNNRKEKERVYFAKDPVESISRLVNPTESWAAYHFEMHARKCAYCHNPYEVHRRREQLCEAGHGMAQEVCRYVYNKSDGITYSTNEEDGKLVRVEIPAGYVEVSGLLKAVERSLRHWSRRSFVNTESLAKKFPPRSPPRPLGPPPSPRPRAGELVDWPIMKVVLGEAKQDALHEVDPRTRRGQEYEVMGHRNTPEEMRHRVSQVCDDRDVESERPFEVESESVNQHHDDDLPGVTINTQASDSWPYQPWQSQSSTRSPGNISTDAIRAPVMLVSSDQGISLMHTQSGGELDISPKRHDTISTLQDNDDAHLHADRVYSDVPHTSFTTVELAPTSDYPLYRIKSFDTTQDQDDLIFSDLDSIFSEVSGISSATGLSVGGFSFGQIASATRELLSVFQDDETLQSIYTAAIYHIGPRLFGKVFRQQLKLYSRKLKDEAEDSLSYSAAQLVSLKARAIVEAIVAKYQTGLAPELSSDVIEQHVEEKSDSSSGEDDQIPGLDESAFNELAQVRAFWVNSIAFHDLQHNLRRLMRPPTSLDNQNETKEHRVESTFPDIARSSESRSSPDSSDASRVVPSHNSLASSESHDMALEPRSQSESAAVADFLAAAAYVVCEVLQQAMVNDKSLFHMHAMFFERGTVEAYAEMLVSFCTTSEWRGKDASRITRASEAELIYICSLSADRTSERVRAIPTPNTRGSPARYDANIFDDRWTSTVPARVVIVETPLLATYSKNGLDLAISSDKQTWRQLTMDIGVSLLPTHLHEVLLAGNGSPLKMTRYPDISYPNRLKTLAEDYTNAEWDWWPLASRIPTPQSGEVRIEWNFVNTKQYICALVDEAKILEEVTAMTAIATTRNHAVNYTTASLYWTGLMNFILMRLVPWWRLLLVPTMTVLIRWSVWFLVPILIGLPLTYLQITLWSNQRVKACSQSEASISGSSNKTGSASKERGSQDGNVSGPRSSSESQLPSHGLVHSSQVHSQATSSSLPRTSLESRRILFGIQGSRWSLDLEQIPVTSLLNDPTFFHELKKLYKKHRSLLKRVVSPFRFRHCRFVKFEKLDVERVISQGDDLPEYPGVTDDYEYAPRPGRNPMITPKTFAVCLKACDSKCRWRLLNPWHDCIRLPPQTYRLRSIPKKKSQFDVHSDDVGLVAWGLEADYAISFVYVAVYHLVPLLGAFSFWIYWLIRYPGDWQNAAVPVLTVLALFAVIWIPLGKLLSTA